MSRWSSTGPHEAVQKFLKKHPEFELVSTILGGGGAVRGRGGRMAERRVREHGMPQG